jgi:hypothetical protein
MANPHENPEALAELQDAIYRDKVLRARAMTPEQRFDAVFELTNSVFERMHEGAMWQLNTTDPQVGWDEVRRRMDRLNQVHDFGFYTTKNPSEA